MLAGLAGAIEISGVEHEMLPRFFAGVGFDAIAVALLARNNPKGMVWAGFALGRAAERRGADANSRRHFH